MRLVRGVQKGDIPKSKVSGTAKSLAKSMEPEDVKDFAKTPDKGLPLKKESILSDKTDGQIKRTFLAMKKKYPSLDGINYDTLNKVFLFALNSKSDADKLKKDFDKKRGKQSFKFIDSNDHTNYNPQLFTLRFKVVEATKEQVQAQSGQEDLENDPLLYINSPDKQLEEDCGCGATEQAIHTSNKLYLKTAVEEAEDFTPELKVGTVVQAYGFPLFSGLKGENFYKIVSIDGDKVTFRRTNETGDIGNMGLGTYTTDLRAIKDAIESVEVGGGTSGLKIWSQPGEGLTNEARGAKTIQKDYDKVIDDIENTLAAYKKAKGTPKAATIVSKLKDLNEKKKKLAAELEDKVSGLYKDAQLKMESKKITKLKEIIREEICKINESYLVYHNSFTSAIDAALNQAHAKGFTYDKEETADKIGLGPKKPSEGKTNKYTINLYRYGKMEKNKKLHIQIYNMGNDLDKPYELNCYIG
jgi:hypothetical protein